MNKDHQHKRQRAVALRYNAAEDAAPRIVAKGAGLLAQSILDIARENDIHIQEDPAMVAVLARLEVNAQIPDELYQAVAEILAFVHRLNQSFEH
jgi:flagellar biosynthesis protein